MYILLNLALSTNFGEFGPLMYSRSSELTIDVFFRRH